MLHQLFCVPPVPIPATPMTPKQPSHDQNVDSHAEPAIFASHEMKQRAELFIDKFAVAVSSPPTEATEVIGAAEPLLAVGPADVVIDSDDEVPIDSHKELVSTTQDPQTADQQKPKSPRPAKNYFLQP